MELLGPHPANRRKDSAVSRSERKRQIAWETCTAVVAGTSGDERVEGGDSLEVMVVLGIPVLQLEIAFFPVE